jgi:hypothetical protein
MKHQQVVPDYVVMLESSITVLALVGCGWLLFKFVDFPFAVRIYLLRGFCTSLSDRLVSACFYFPQYMKNLELEAEKANQHVEKTLMPKGTIEEETAEDGDENAGPSTETEVKDEEKVDKEESSQDSSDENDAPETEKLTEEEVVEESKEQEALDSESKKDK